ncbi:hypothetical protein TYRP_011264 [Tyrophagus putrescentiae]|nr:hypothetical protein TYRP_011264 [Tyrophagus putrescentiae]
MVRPSGRLSFYNIFLLLILLIVLVIVYVHCRFILPRLLAMTSLFDGDKRLSLVPESSENSSTNFMAKLPGKDNQFTV